MKFVILAGAVSLLAIGCGRSGPVTDAAQGCDWTSYILISQQDELTEGTAEQIEAHNETRERFCSG